MWRRNKERESSFAGNTDFTLGGYFALENHVVHPHIPGVLTPSLRGLEAKVEERYWKLVGSQMNSTLKHLTHS